MDELSPEARAEKIGHVLEREYDAHPAQAVAELLADVRHYCDAQGLAYHELDRRAHGFYLAEVLSVPA